MRIFIFRQLIYNYPEQLFADAKVMGIEHADFDGIERLALVTGMFWFVIKILNQIPSCDIIVVKWQVDTAYYSIYRNPSLEYLMLIIQMMQQVQNI